MDADPVSYANQLALRVQGIASVPEREMLSRLKYLFRLLVDPGSMSDGDERFVNAIATAALSLEAVGEVGVHFARRPALKQLVVSNLDRLIPWVQYYYRAKIRNVLDPIHTKEDGKQMLIRNMSAVFLAIGTPEDGKGPLHPHIESNYDVITGLWYEEDAQHPINTRNTLSQAFASQLLCNIFTACSSYFNAPLMQSFIKSADGDVDRVANITLSKLRQALKAKPCRRYSITQLHFIATVLAADREHVFTRSFQQHQVFTTFAKCVRLLSDIPAPANFGDKKFFDMTCDCYFRILPTMLLSYAENNTRALRQSVRYGALEGVAQMLVTESSTAMQDPEVSILKDTFNLLQISLGIRSVCVDVQRAFKRLPPLVEIPKSPGRKLWKQFTEQVMIQSVFLKVVKQLNARRMKAGHTCSHCLLRFPKNTLKKCGRCRSAVYCSERCQAEDWKKDHKNRCNYMERDMKSPHAEVMHYEDRIFTTTIAQYEIRRHRAHLRDLMKRKYPNVHPDFVGFAVDFLRGSPPSYSSFLIDELVEDDEMTRNAKRTVIEMAEVNKAIPGRHTTLIRVQYPNMLQGLGRKDIITETYDEGDRSDYPVLRPGITRTGKRPSGRLVDTNIPLEACYDEIDEIVRVMWACAAKHPYLMQEPMRLVEEALKELKYNSPFMLSFQPWL